jgi:hypothetical protein
MHPRIAVVLPLATPTGSIPRVHTSAAGERVPLLLAAACTLGIVALFLAPAWLPSWRRWQADRWRRSSTTKAATQRFAEAVAHGDFNMAETEAQRLLDRG